MFRDRLVPDALRLAQSRIVAPIIVETEIGKLYDVFEETRPFLGEVELLPRLIDFSPLGAWPFRLMKRFSMFAGILPREVIFDLAEDDRVAKIYPDRIVETFQYPTVPSYGVFEAYRRPEKPFTFTSTWWTKRAIGAMTANEKGYRGRGVLVGIVDTGASRVHEQIRRAEFETVIKTQHRDENGHGSWCTSCVGGVPSMDTYLSDASGKRVLCEGMAPECGLLAIKALGYYIGCGCFTKGNRILTVKRDGTRYSKKISLIKKGDILINYNPGSGKFEKDKVVGTYKREMRDDELLYEINTNEGHTLVATEEHPFLVNDVGWVKASELKAGEHLLAYEVEPKFTKLAYHSRVLPGGKKGQPAWNKGRKWAKEIVDKISKHKRFLYRRGLIRVWNKGLKGIHLSPKSEFEKDHIPHNKGKKLPPSTRKKVSLSVKRWFNEHPGSGKRHSRCMKEFYRDNPLAYEKQLKHLRKARRKASFAMKRLWRNKSRKKEIVRNVLRASRKRPSTYEKRLIEVIQRYNLPYRYVGDGSLIIGGKNPDFVENNGGKKLIEVFGKWWHTESDTARRISHFKKYGYETLVIWGSEFDNKESLVERLKSFTDSEEPRDPVITEVKPLRKREMVYDLETERNHTLVVNGIIVHNSTSNIIEAIGLGIDRGASIISLSLGSNNPPETKPEDDAFYPVFEEGAKYGIIPVCAAGNAGPEEGSVGSPGNLPNCLSIGAYNPVTGDVAEFSSRGPTKWGAIRPDCTMPGVNTDSASVGICDVAGDGKISRYSPISGTCLTDSAIVDKYPIDELEAGDSVPSLLGMDVVLARLDQGINKVYQIALDNGIEIEATPEHRFLILRNNRFNWVPLIGLYEGDKVAISMECPKGKKKIIGGDKKELVEEGAYSLEQGEETWEKPSTFQEIKGKMEKSKVQRGNEKEGMERLLGEPCRGEKPILWKAPYRENKGINSAESSKMGKETYDRPKIQKAVENWLPENKSGFIGGKRKVRKRWIQSNSTSSLLPRTRPNSYKRRKGIWGRGREFQAREIQQGYQILRRIPTLPIKKIRYLGKKQVYDITTSSHNFIANGIVVHNSMATPHASGILALMCEAFKRGLGKVLTLDEIKRMLEALCDHPKNNDAGWGSLTWQKFEQWVEGEYDVRL